jgi:hypothetical protein
MNPPESSLTVICHAGFDESGVWVIDTRITWRDGPPPLGSVLLGAARSAMLTAIDAEARRGRMLGATKVRVHLEGHEGRTLGDPGRR